MNNKLIFTVLTLIFLNLLNVRNSLSAKKPIIFPNTERVLIFKKNPIANKDKKNSFYTLNHIRYYDENLIYTEKEIRNTDKNDTIKINSNSKYLSVDLFHNYIIYNYYLRQSDTTFFSFESDIPLAGSNSKEQKYYDLNFSLAAKIKFQKPLKMTNQFPSASKSTLTTEQQYRIVYLEYHNQILYLDSLLNKNLISKDIKELLIDKNKFEFASKIFSNPNFRSFTINSVDDHNFLEMLNNEKLITHDYFNKFIIWNYLWSNEIGIKRIKHAQGISLDYKQAYGIVETKFTNLKIKNHILFYCLQMIQSEEPTITYQSFLKKFKQQPGVDYYVTYMEKNFGKTLRTTIGYTTLINFSKTKRIEFGEFLKSIKGNVVYVDLWASWCLPCRAAMPYSKNLAKLFQNDKIKFVYISIDEKFTDWYNAAIDEGLKANQNSFLLLEPKKSSFLKEINLKTIPRYLIYDKSGKLVYINAPSPESAELKILLKKYLTE